MERKKSKMDKISSVSEFLAYTKDFPKTIFYRGECKDYGDTACVAKAIRDAMSYESYINRLETFDRMVRENALLDKPEVMVPFAQHSGLATKLLDISSSPLVALYFACQETEKSEDDGYIYIFDDYADATDLLDKYPRFDLEDELLKHLDMLDEQKRRLKVLSPIEQEIEFENRQYTAVEHNELTEFGKIIEIYRNKYLRGGYSRRALARRIDEENSPFLVKWKELTSLIEGIKTWITQMTKNKPEMDYLLPKNHKDSTPAIDFVHPYKEKRYAYYNEQYNSLDIEVKEYMISLECLVAFINDRCPVGNFASMSQLSNLTMDFLPNLLYRPILTFKRGLSQQSSFFVQTLFDKHELNIYNVLDNMVQDTNPSQTLPRQLLKCQANYSERIVIDGSSKEAILFELDKYGVNRATMFGDADSIAEYIMNDNFRGEVLNEQ